jgi:hypothetical protein
VTVNPTPPPRTTIGLVLAQLAGAQRDVLRKAPTETVKHAAMGGVLLTTAGAAGVSAAFALNNAVGVPVVPAIVTGILWASVIFNLDRMLIVSMTRQSGWLRILLTAVPRLALAVVIGAVISVPLVLQIFRPEINAELALLRTDNKAEALANLDRQYADIPDLQTRVDQLQAVVAGRSQDAVAADPDVVAAQKKVDDAQAAYTTAANEAQCELVGSCGTNTAGVGEAYRQAQRRADDALIALTAARARLTEVTSAAQTRITEGATNNKQAAQNELNTLGPRLAERKAGRVTDQGLIDSGQDQSNGLLAQLQALDRLSLRSPSMDQARLALFLLFLSIEVLPVLVKLLTLVGRPSLYDRVLEGDEQLLETRADNERGVAKQLEKHRVDEQVRQGKIANSLLVDEQTKIAKKAIGVWGQVAAMRTDAELDRWLKQYTGQTAPTGPSQSGGQQPAPPAAGGAAAPTVALPVVTPPPASTPPPPPPSSPPPSSTPPASPPATVPSQAGSPLGGPTTYQQYKARVGPPSTNGHQPPGPTPTGP